MSGKYPAEILMERSKAWRDLLRPCACHPDERPPVCQHKYAFSECAAAYEATAHDESEGR